MKLSDKFMKRFKDICGDRTGIPAVDEKYRQMAKRRKRHGYNMPARLGSEVALERVLEEFKAQIKIFGPEVLLEDFHDQLKHWVFDFYNESDFSYLKFIDESRILVEYNCQGQCALHKY